MAKVDVEMKPIKSSNAEGVGYDADKKELFITFKGGATYKYSNVPASIYQDLVESESFGKFLSQKIKGVYAFEKLGD